MKKKRNNGPKPLTPEETVELTSWFRNLILINNLKMSWKEAKVIFFFLAGLIIFIGFMTWEMEDEEFGAVMLALFSFLPIMMVDMKYCNMFKLTFFLRSDINFIYPSLMDRGSLVRYNVITFLAWNLIIASLYLILISLFIVDSAIGTVMSMGEIALVMFVLVSLKIFSFFLYNTTDTLRRMGRISENWDFLLTPYHFLLMFIFGAFDLFLLVVMYPQAGYFFQNVILSTSLWPFIIIGSIVLSIYLWFTFLDPNDDNYWHEDRIKLPIYMVTQAAQRSTIMGEDGRELDKSQDFSSKFKLFDPSELPLKENRTGMRALTGKCNTVFWREYFNSFLSILIPVLIVYLITYPFPSSLAFQAFSALIFEIVILGFLWVVTMGGPLNQEPYAIENTLLIPIPPWDLVVSSITQNLKAAMSGVVLALMLFFLLFGYTDSVFLIYPVVILTIGACGVSILITVCSIHMKHDFYPQQIQRGAAQFLWKMLIYIGMILGYVFLILFSMFEPSPLTFMFLIISGLIYGIGPFASHHLLKTISIH